MTYGEMKDFVLQLLNVYSVAGSKVAQTYNDQADLIARIPALTRDGLLYVTTTVRRLRASAELTGAEKLGTWLVYDLPEDCYQLCGGLLRVDGDGVQRVRNYQVLAGRREIQPKFQDGVWLAEYFRYPAVPAGIPEDDDFLDCPPEAQSAVAYYVAAHLAMEDNNYLHGALYNEFEMKLLRLQEGQFLECGVTEDVYAAG